MGLVFKVLHVQPRFQAKQVLLAVLLLPRVLLLKEYMQTTPTTEVSVEQEWNLEVMLLARFQHHLQVLLQATVLVP